MPKQLLQKTDFLKTLFDAVPSFLLLVDEDVRIYHLNVAARNLLHTDKEAVYRKRGGEALHCIHSTESPEGCGRAPACAQCVVRNSVGRAFQGSSVHRETAKMELRGQGGTNVVFLMVTASPLRYEDRRFVLLILEDITKLKRTEEDLARHAARLEAVNKELEAFSYTVSHDLKAPLRSICSFSDILREEYAPKLDEQGGDYLRRIQAAGVQMTQLVDDLLELSRVTGDELRREDVDMAEIARDVAGAVMSRSAGRSIEFVIASGLRAHCDRRLVRVALENLIGNAAKFTSSHPKARIEFGALTRDGRNVYFVKDDGAGFDMAYAADLFMPFKRLHTASQFPGTGIGLATVRRIIHRHEGHIWAESAVEQGASFYFTL